jgi:hypothetical protein
VPYLFLLLILLTLPSPLWAQQAKAAPAPKQSAVRELSWDDLMPAGEEKILADLYEKYFAKMQADPNKITEGSAQDQMHQIGTFNTVKELNGLRVRLPGYPVPFDFSAQGTYKEFLLVPYFGACIHAPPPPPNQIVYVSSPQGQKISNIADPIWVDGILSTQKNDNDLGDAAYTLKLLSTTPYEGE